MKKVIHERSRARIQALQLLYQSEITEENVLQILESGEYTLEDGPLDDYAVSIVKLVDTYRDQIDVELDDVATNWRLERMSIVDRNILRIATVELFYGEKLPVAVAIDEAVKLAKRYAGDESSKFVNGVLRGMLDRYKEQESEE